MTAPPAANATTMEIERKNRPRMIVSCLRLARETLSDFLAAKNPFRGLPHLLIENLTTAALAIKRHKPATAIGSGKILRKQTLRFLQVLAIGQVNTHQ
jgi:hypothetical protein